MRSEEFALSRMLGMFKMGFPSTMGMLNIEGSMTGRTSTKTPCVHG